MPDTSGTAPHRPSMDPGSDEASPAQLDAARRQGEAFGAALRLMTGDVAQEGAETAAGDYLVGYAVEEAEGLYELRDGELTWQEPGDDNVHVEIAVRDGADGRFVPGLHVEATLWDPDGNRVGTHEQPMLWHPMIYHYGRNWRVPRSGDYRLRIHIDPPSFARHDRRNGRRFTEPVEVEFAPVHIATGQG